MLETIREYAADRLAEVARRGAQRCGHRHAAFFRELAEASAVS